jgi:serine-type D-Ala-D-Ala carboxypeptidase (penicillin-binding protein 5/6)
LALGIVVVICLGGGALAYMLVSGGGTPDAPAASAPLVRSSRPLAVVTPDFRSNLAASIVFPGKAGALPFPGTGESAVVVGGAGLVASTPDERSVPVASLTKIMTAYLILRDHPLIGREGGPVFVMTLADHQAWVASEEADQSNIEVKRGERLDERQLLQALMIPSADNIANYLAVWDAGSVRAFVAKMNATATALGLRQTHFADPSGVSPKSRSSAVDMARLAALAMSDPVLRSITDEQSIRLPVTGEIWNNYDPAVGVDGIIGVKSGFTDAAETNLVSAAWRDVHGHRVLVVCDVIRQPNTLYGDAQEDEALLSAVSGELRLAQVVAGNAAVGQETAEWNHDRSVVRVDLGAEVVGWPGLVLTPLVLRADASRLDDRHGWAAGCTVGTFRLDYPYGPAFSEPAVLESAIAPPPAGWRPPGGHA